MSAATRLSARQLRAAMSSARIPWHDSREIPFQRLLKSAKNAFQPRAMAALELAVRVHSSGHHVYLSGEANLGRSYMLLSFLKPLAKKSPIPPDLVYVRDFANPDSPKLMSLPAGQGRKFRDSIKNLIENITKNLENRLDSINFMRQRTKLMDQFQEARSSMVEKMTAFAHEKGFSLEMDENGSFNLSPLLNGKKASSEELENLDASLKSGIKHRGDSLAKNMIGLSRQLNKIEESFRDSERALELKAMGQTLNTLFNPLERRLLKHCPNGEMKTYLHGLREDILKNTEEFLRPDFPQQGDEHPFSSQTEAFFQRYEINLFVDNSGTAGAPVIIEDNPTFANLLGRVDREAEMGTLVTDLTLIRPGSIHKANGGFLVLHAEYLLQHPLAWEGLMRALRTGEARIEDGTDWLDAGLRAKGLQPAPLGLDLKVVLIGDEDIYETLLMNDERFAKIFRIKAHMAQEAQRSNSHVRFYLAQIGQIISDGNLPSFDAGALAWLVDMGSLLCEDQRKLSLKFPLLRELMLEAAAGARMRGRDVVSAELLEEAWSNREYRSNLIEETYMEEYDREMIKLPTNGEAVGHVNGLSIAWNGDYEFGLPQQISCAVGVGHEGIIDLEREADLGGPIHTKAMMILKSFLTDLFASKKPLVLSASLYFEQSYGGIEGDSASGAELVALLSALANVRVRLDLAFTGAVSHAGQIMAVGGVTRKIEGFYKVCAKRGLTGTQGVIIPRDNIDHLMLSQAIIKSVEKGEFSIYSVARIEEALELLTGIPAGKKRKNGSFTPGSLYDLVDKRLESLGCYAQNAFRRQRGNSQ